MPEIPIKKTLIMIGVSLIVLQILLSVVADSRYLIGLNLAQDKFIGAIVNLLDLDTDEKMTYMMVSPEEANYEENKLSIYAPIGKGLMGKKAGETVEIKVPAGLLKYKIEKIKRPK